MDPLAFIGVILLAIVVLVTLTVKLNIHPFIVLFIVAVMIGLLTGNSVVGTLELITENFGSTLAGIGVLIIFGAVIASGIKDTGASMSIANFFIKLFRGKRLELAPALTGFFMSIPVFGDIAIVLNAPISAVLAKRKNISMTRMAPMLNIGLTLTHGLVIPTPGILAVAVLLGADLGQMLIWGLTISAIAFALTYLIAMPILRRGEYIAPLEQFTEGISPIGDDAPVEDLLIKDKDLPRAWMAFTPIVIPTVMIAIGAIGQLLAEEGTALYAFLGTIGNAIVALFCGIIAAAVMAFGRRGQVAHRAREATEATLSPHPSFLSIVGDNWITRALYIAMVPLMVTAMGGAMGGIIRENEAIETIGETVGSSGFPAILIPFILSAVLMAVAGSMTVAAMTAAAIVMPILPILGLSPVVAALAIGAGSMCFWHVNNSGFWIFTSLYNFTPKQGLKYFTTTNTLGGTLAFLVLLGLTSVGLVS